ncbi:DUF3616 domain-containing protein [Sinorhizobium meliloti]|uniref:DUF3616 domain-containing protein n=1 Tax=Rhizobium meliloti TaxID=382 RepID=UPI000FD55E84|nr:DUF3616 domain-containing protein [Sinorhizobium meliloti]RVH05448.1 DUF3616 domain-containing protein [Sinorhizobium meliloti]
MNTERAIDFHLAGQIRLDCGATDVALLRNLSGCTAAGSTLWTVSDEGRTLERLTHGVDSYQLSEQIKLDEYIDAVPGSADDELDLESLEAKGPYLWLCGAHCRVRRKPGPDEIVSSNIRERKSRRVLARLRLDETKTRLVEAESIPSEGTFSLRSKLEDDQFLSPFRELPTKENGIDVEGLALMGDRVFIGLRGPVVGGLAVVMELFIDETFRIKSTRPFFLNLQGLGVRELTHDGASLLVMAGPVGEAPGPFALFRWSPEPGSVPSQVYSWGASIEKPEGLCCLEMAGERGLLVLYDSPQESRMQDGSYLADWLLPVAA